MPDRAMQTAGIFVQAAVRRLAYNDDELRCPDVQRHHSSHIVRLQQLLYDFIAMREGKALH